MDVERDVVGVSIPFLGGVCMAALMPNCTDFHYSAAAVCSIACVGLLFLFCGRGDRLIPAIALFFSVGAFCYSSSRVLAYYHPITKSTGPALDLLLSAIDKCDFKNESTEGLIKALMTGVKDDLDRRIISAFRDSGASHILALSGLHLGIIYGILNKALSWLGRSPCAMCIRSLIIIIISFLYVRLTGAGASITRAFLFILFNELSRLLPGRLNRPAAVFSASLTVQLASTPLLVRTISFQLSYLAMLGINIVFPKIKNWYKGSGKLDIIKRIWDLSAMSLSCQLFTAPLVWIYFQSFPIYFLLTNLIALPLTEITIAGAFLTILLSALGICPEVIKNLTELVGQIMIRSLELISSIS